MQIDPNTRLSQCCASKSSMSSRCAALCHYDRLTTETVSRPQSHFDHMFYNRPYAGHIFSWPNPIWKVTVHWKVWRRCYDVREMTQITANVAVLAMCLAIVWTFVHLANWCSLLIRALLLAHSRCKQSNVAFMIMRFSSSDYVTQLSSLLLLIYLLHGKYI